MNESIYNNPLYWKGEGQAFLLGKGQVLGADPNFLAAIEAFNKSLEIASESRNAFWTPQSNSETWWLRGNSYYLLGNKFEREKNHLEAKNCYSSAIDCYIKAIENFPLNYDAWIKKAQIEALKLNRTDDADFSSLQAIRINPNYGYQAWGFRRDSEMYPLDPTLENYNKSFSNFYQLNSKINSSNQFSSCEIPTNTTGK